MLYTNFQIEAMLPAYGNLKTIEAKDVSNVSNAFLTPQHFHKKGI